MSIFDIFLILGLVLVLMELVVGVETGFDLVMIGVTLIVSSLAGRWFGSLEVMIGLTVILSLTYILIGRSAMQSKLKVQTHASNADKLLGHEGIVTQAIQRHEPGLVKVDGEEWRAKSNTNLPIGTEVSITKVEGVTITVKKENT